MAGAKRYYVLVLNCDHPTAQLLSNVRDNAVRGDDGKLHPDFHCRSIDSSGPLLVADPTEKSNAAGIGQFQVPYSAVLLIGSFEYGKSDPFGFDPSKT